MEDRNGCSRTTVCNRTRCKFCGGTESIAMLANYLLLLKAFNVALKSFRRLIQLDELTLNLCYR